jgi:hypothetical protein
MGRTNSFEWMWLSRDVRVRIRKEVRFLQINIGVELRELGVEGATPGLVG